MNHLTEDQINDLLIGDAAAGAVAHIDACPVCMARFAAAREPLTSFNAASLAWGQRRSATLPLQIQPRPAGLFTGHRLTAAVGAATAGIVALALALPWLHHRSSATGTTQQAATLPASSAAAQPALPKPPSADAQLQAPESPAEAQQIARDNQLLQAIDRELAASETPADLVKMAGQQDAHQISPDMMHND